MSGTGKFTNPMTFTGIPDIYTGQFKNGLFHGVGTMCYGSRSVYSGQWECGVKCGRGTETGKTGLIFEHNGGYKDNKCNGLGLLTFRHGAVAAYQGEFSHGVFHGKGQITKRDGSVTNVQYVEGSKFDPNSNY